MQWFKHGRVKNAVNVSKTIFHPLIHHAHLQNVCSIPVMYYKVILMILVEVDDFTKYALLAIIQYVQWSKIGCVKNAIDLSKYIFSQSNLFMHIINMYVIHLQTTKGYTEVSVRSCSTKFAILALYCRHHAVRIT